MKKKLLIVIMVVMVLVGCRLKIALAEEVYIPNTPEAAIFYKIDVLKSVIAEQSRLIRESKDLRYRNIYYDNLAITSSQIDELILQYLRAPRKK